MDNKKTGEFIAQRRKEINLSQKQLAEKLNVTDKAVSKWETGRGAPDISLLTAIADSLKVTVIELLEGEFLEKSEAQAQTEKVVIEALQKAKKQQTKTAISIFTALTIIFFLINAVTYGYWGRRHKVLYNVDTVYVNQDEENPDKYDFYYNCSVENWWFDFNEHTYNLKAELSGEPGSWDFSSKTYPVTSTNSSETFFVIHVEFDASSVAGYVPIEDVVMRAEFSAYDENGESDERANLYMSDFNNAKIIMI
ncbi:MAG: helix-turn-helix transcriptional regulator [Clostridia bacterium]|nr:helix-turn-helix transcriptional regulator [Clostridia bacterium]